MSDRSDEILKSLGKLKPNEMREIIENLASQSPHAEKWPTPELDKLAQLAHLPNRLSAEDIINRATINEQSFYWHIVDGLFDCMVDSRDAATEQEAIDFAYNPEQMQPWYSTSKRMATLIGLQPKKVSSKEFRAWIRKEST